MRNVPFLSGSIRCSSALVVCLVAGHASAAVINVPADQPTIQAAVNAANTGDEIVVADGVYSGAGFTNIDLQSKDLIIRSANGAASTTLDGGFTSRAFNISSGQTSATVIDGFTFQNHGDFLFTDQGGAILVQNASPIIRNSVFSGGGALDGGAIAAIGSGDVLIENCEFGNPDFVDAGGAIFVSGPAVTVSGCEFRDIDLWSASGGDGAAIYTNSGELNIVDCVFENGFAGRGGAMWVGATDVTISGTTFLNNRATDQGGAIWVNSAFLNSVENTDFIGNEAVDLVGGGISRGGAIRFLGTTSVGHFVNCLFEDNKATNTPGVGSGEARAAAVYAFSPTVSFTDCDFLNNITNGANDGDSIHGALTIVGSAVVTVTGCRFEGNVARSLFNPDNSAWGAAISLFTSTAELAIDDSEFIGNDGQQGVVYIQGFTGSPRTPATVTNSLFENNTTNFGALRIVTSTETTVSNCVFRGNTASVARGAIAIQNEDTVSLVEDCLFENNTSAGTGGAVGIFNALEVTIRNSVFDGNSGTSGGGIRIDNSSTGAHAMTVLVDGCEFRNNDAGFGAGVSLPLFANNFDVELTVRDSLFESNTGSWGAGVHSQGFVTDGVAPTIFPTVNIENSTFRNNTTTGGGAIRFNTGAVASVVGSLIEDNNTNGSGGGVWAQGVSGDGIRDTVIRNNNAVLNGGGVFHTALVDGASTLNITNSLIAGNNTEIGGGLYAEGDTTTNLLNVTVAENSAELMANSINADTGADVRLDNSIVWSDSGVASDQVAAGFDSEITANWSNIQGGEAGVTGAGTTNWLSGNINADPEFANAAGGDYALGEGSASVDAGDSSLVVGIDFDLAGNPRVVDAVNYADTGPASPAVDHGAYEAPADLPGSGGPTCPPDINGDGVVDADDFFAFLGFFASGDPIADFNNDGVIDADDFFAFLAAFAAGC